MSEDDAPPTLFADEEARLPEPPCPKCGRREKVCAKLKDCADAAEFRERQRRRFREVFGW